MHVTYHNVDVCCVGIYPAAIHRVDKSLNNTARLSLVYELRPKPGRDYSSYIHKEEVKREI